VALSIRRRLLGLAALVASLLLACDREGGMERTEAARRDDHPPLISLGDRCHDFGAVVGGPGAKATHRYRLVNAASDSVRLVAVNLKPCCGRVEIDREVVPPGGTAEVEVALTLNGRSGGLGHVAIVSTSQGETIELRTTATVQPALRVRPLDSSPPRVVMGSDRAAESRFLAVAAGTPDDPPLDLKRMEFDATIPVRWDDPDASRESSDGIESMTRPLAARLDPTGPPGPRSATIAFRLEGGIVHRSTVEWTVVAPIAAAPESIVLDSKSRVARVVLSSQDGRPFHVKRVACAEPTIQGRAEVDGPATRHAVQFEAPADPPAGVHPLTIETDHPTSPRVQLRVVVLD